MARTLRWILAVSLAAAVGPAAALAQGGEVGAKPSAAADSQDAQFTQKLAAAQISLERLDEPLRGKVSRLLQQEVIYSRGQMRAFPCKPFAYHWLLDNPHLAARAWQGLGAKCATIEKKSDGVFAGVDPTGGSVQWQRLCEYRGWKAWYAEGTGRPAPFAPAMTLRALVMLSYQEVRGADGRVGIRHQIEVLSQLEGRSNGWLSKLTAGAVDRSAKQTLEQIELFFSGMAWYVSANPGSARKLLTVPAKDAPADAQQIELVLRALEER